MTSHPNTFSIVTIVYNDVLHILETIDSVISQTHKDIEYILIDGASTDGTKEAILDYLQTHTTITREENSSERLYMEATHSIHPTLTFKFLSQKDGGIYDAMNKGIALVTKEWINFMNCGDRFYDSQVLEKIAKENITEFDVVYGDTEIIESQHSYIAKVSNRFNRMNFCHQSSFTKTMIMKENYFDLDFKICADNALFLKLRSEGRHFLYLPFTISSYDLQGISSSLSWQMFYEDCKIGYKYNKLFPLYLGIKYILWTIPKRVIKNIFTKHKAQR